MLRPLVPSGCTRYEPASVDLSLFTGVPAFHDQRMVGRPNVVDPDRVIEGAPAADEALAMESLPDHLQDALNGLPDEFRTVVILCDVAGLTYHEIADQIGVPVGTVRSRVHRGRVRLREVLS